jgi:hypothetical protein
MNVMLYVIDEGLKLAMPNGIQYCMSSNRLFTTNFGVNVTRHFALGTEPCSFVSFSEIVK